MSKRLRLLSVARTDIANAFAYYESESRGLGVVFLQILEGLLDHVVEYPEFYPQRIGQTRRALVPRFPYAVFYIVDAEEITILGVRHTKQDPGSMPTA
ncbi:MAG: type II toxin-antitoxin system RelE/ParE family toxin [Bacteroidetes bacterium]|nr:type II toxin-antitoxin system RelE/ParE family toxin [Bacteroidota bacterium]